MPKSQEAKNHKTQHRGTPKSDGMRLAKELLRVEREFAKMHALAAQMSFDEEEVLRQLHERLRKRAESLLGRR